MQPKLINSSVSIDSRGVVLFNNEFDLSNYKRQYVIKNFKNYFIRAWHGHKLEAKAVQILTGSILICCVKIDNWEKPSKNLEVKKFYLSKNSSVMLIIPPGYANGWMNLEQDTQVQFFSTSTLDDSLKDDIRFDYDYWNPWEVNFS